MGSRLLVEGPNDTIELRSDNITSVIFESDTPDGSNARATDIGFTLKISGKIIASVDGSEVDDTRKVALWSLVSAEKADAYRNATLETIAADRVVRKVNFPNAFIVDYTESFDHSQGIGTFDLVIRQKKDKHESVTIEGNYAAE